MARHPVAVLPGPAPHPAGAVRGQRAGRRRRSAPGRSARTARWTRSAVRSTGGAEPCHLAVTARRAVTCWRRTTAAAVSRYTRSTRTGAPGERTDLVAARGRRPRPGAAGRRRTRTWSRRPAGQGPIFAVDLGTDSVTGTTWTSDRPAGAPAPGRTRPAPARGIWPGTRTDGAATSSASWTPVTAYERPTTARCTSRAGSRPATGPVTSSRRRSRSRRTAGSSTSRTVGSGTVSVFALAGGMPRVGRRGADRRASGRGTSRSAEHLYVANERSDTVRVFRRGSDTGVPEAGRRPGRCRVRPASRPWNRGIDDDVEGDAGLAHAARPLRHYCVAESGPNCFSLRNFSPNGCGSRPPSTQDGHRVSRPPSHAFELHLAAVAATAGVLVVVLTGAWFGYRELIQPSCSGEIRLAVAAASEIAPAVDAAAPQWVKDGAAVAGTCVRVDVTASDPVDVAAVVGGQARRRAGRRGPGQGTAGQPRRLGARLLDLAAAAAKKDRPRSRRPTAPRSRAARSWSRCPSRSPRTRLAGQEVQLDRPAQAGQQHGTRLRTGIVEPTRDAAGLAGLLSLTAAAAGAGGRRPAQHRRRAPRHWPPDGPRSATTCWPGSRTANDPTSIASGLGAAPLSEEDVDRVQREEAAGAARRALHGAGADRRWTTRTRCCPASSRARPPAAKGAVRAAHQPDLPRPARRASACARRTATGARVSRRPQGRRARPAARPTAPARRHRGRRPRPGRHRAGRLQLVGRHPVRPDARRHRRLRLDAQDGADRQQPTRERSPLDAARRGLGLFDDSWSIGLWTFSTELDGSRDYRQLVPIGPLSGQRAELERALAAITPKPSGDTGLYDTMLAAYQAVQEDWEPGRVNSVVLFTDGKNEDANGLNQRAAARQAEADRRPGAAGPGHHHRHRRGGQQGRAGGDHQGDRWRRLRRQGPGEDRRHLPQGHRAAPARRADADARVRPAVPRSGVAGPLSARHVPAGASDGNTSEAIGSHSSDRQDVEVFRHSGPRGSADRRTGSPLAEWEGR